MPELPEVETVRRQLEKRIVGSKISRIKILEEKQFFGDPKEILGRKIKGLWRRAKILAIDIDDFSLLIHLKMTGQIIYLPGDKGDLISVGHPLPFSPDRLPNNTTRIIIGLGDGSRLFFNDLRKFGWLKVLTSDQVKEVLLGLGPEPLGEDFTLGLFRQKLAKTKRAIKLALLDQAIVAGIGNIYANETLFKAGIDPRRRANSLSFKELTRLYRAIRSILAAAIEHGGTSAADQAYLKPDALPGHYQNFLKVYQREGEECFRCDGRVMKITQANRSTYFCPGCQK
jgi:formamidopyrimidine-DNA glycosylase